MKNLRVIQKLFLSYAVIFVLFVIASACFFGLSNTVISNFSYFHDHPYKVVNTTKDLKMEIMSVRIAVKDMIMKNDAAGVPAMHQQIDASHQRVMEHIGSLRDRYLGDKADIDAFEKTYQQWLIVVNDVLAYLQKGDTAAAGDLSVNMASGQASDMFDELDKIMDFASSKADSFYNQASASHLSTEVFSLVFLAAALFLSVILAVMLTKNITHPIKEMSEFIQKVENGQEITGMQTGGRKDELGKVMDAFNDMLVYLKTKKELSEMKLTLEHQKTLEQYRITLLSIGDAVISTDTQGRVTHMNPVAERLTGWLLEDAKGRHVEEVFHIINAKTRQKAENPLEKVLSLGIVMGLANHTVLISKGRKEYHIADSAAPIKDDKGVLFGVVLVFKDVSEDYRKQEEIAHMSFHDRLTGLYNRAFFEEEIMRLNTARQMPLSVVMADINGLKLINDTFGHHEGDKYLVEAANALKSCCREEDVVARWGGDEFVILLPKTTMEESQQICARITQKYSAIRGFKITPSIAIGSATQSDVMQDYQKTLKDAETNMYRHKLLDSSSVRSAIIASLDNSLYERDTRTEDHVKGLSGICSAVGRCLGLSDSECDKLELLARLHDIGKIAINENILMKPEPLDLEEWISMKKHTEIGYRIAKSISDLEHVAEGILSHHERWDGSGYPRGLSGSAIPYDARIIAVADAYDAMTRGRPYRPALSHVEALAELSRCAGTQFDPAVVEAFLQVLDDGWKQDDTD